MATSYMSATVTAASATAADGAVQAHTRTPGDGTVTVSAGAVLLAYDSALTNNQLRAVLRGFLAGLGSAS